MNALPAFRAPAIAAFISVAAYAASHTPALGIDGTSDSTGPGEIGPLTGKYAIRTGRNPNGSTYTGDVVIGHDGDAVRILWRFHDGSAHGGVEILKGDVLGAGWGSPDRHGVVVYEVSDGRLRGLWASEGTGANLGVEDLEGPPGLSGTYRIVRGRSPLGSTYHGEVEIRPVGEGFVLTWRLPNESYDGVGLLRDGVLFVGWGVGDVGIVVYDKRGDDLFGVWLPPGGAHDALGTENLVRR